MSRTEILRRSTDDAHKARLTHLRSEMERAATLLAAISRRTDELQAVSAKIPQEMASALEPIAVAMAALAEEVSDTLQMLPEQTLAAQQEAACAIEGASRRAAGILDEMDTRSAAMIQAFGRLERAAKAAQPNPRQTATIAMVGGLAGAMLPTAYMIWLLWRGGVALI